MKKRQKGFNLVELTIFIVVSTIAMVGILSVFQSAGARTAQAFEQKRSLEAAQMLLEEVLLMPFTYCDPTDPVAASANSEADCTIAQGFGPNLSQTRGGANPFNHVKDYHGYTQIGVTDISGNSIAGLSTATASISVSSVALAGVPASEAVRIAVTVTRGSDSSTMYGYKTRYAPSQTP